MNIELATKLTKREHMATVIMQGLLANPTSAQNTALTDFTTASVAMADALLKELEKEL